MFSVVVATQDVVGPKMAGPGIRAWNLARELSRHFPTTLISERNRICQWRFPPQAVEKTANRSSDPIVFSQPMRGLPRGRKRIFDLFDPILLELREMYGAHPTLRERVHFAAEQWRLKRALETGDLIVCATPAQRELYRKARGPIIEVPFGIDLDDIAPAGRREDVVVWGGGTWPWLDPATAVEAIVRLNGQGVPCRLLFLGRTRPNQHRPDHLDPLLGSPYVEANAGWVPYDGRLSSLRQAKIAIMLHHPTPEARYSIRTRLFDAMVTATPVIATEEGFAAELVAREGLGIVVPPSDVNAVAEAIRRLLKDDTFHRTCVSNLERIRPRFAWPVVARPLIEAVSEWQKQF